MIYNDCTGGPSYGKALSECKLENYNLSDILKKLCKDKEERNFFKERIESIYQNTEVYISGYSYFPEESDFSFDERTGSVINGLFGKKRKIEFYKNGEYFSFITF